MTYSQSFPEDGFLRFTHTHNTGSAFGLFQGQNMPLILVAIVGVTVLAVIYLSQRQPSNLLLLSLGLQMGGAAGNLLDRLCLLQTECQGSLMARLEQGYVTDFIDVDTWPVFNLADSSIVVGLVLLGWLFLRPERLGIGRKAPLAVAYARCPICDADMLPAGDGWRCAGCGVREQEWEDAGPRGTTEPSAVKDPSGGGGFS